MRIQTVLTTISLSNAVSGALLVLAFWQSSPAITWVVVGLAIAISVAATAWGILKTRSGLSVLKTQMESTETSSRKIGITELDEVGQRFTQLLANSKQTSLHESQELRDVKSLLARVDRRKGNFDRDGKPVECATQLLSILKGCGRELDSNIRQAISCGREIHRVTDEIVSGTESQSDSVDQTTSFIERLSNGIISVSDNAEIALQSSAKAQTTAKNGLVQFQELIDEMKQIRNHAAARERKLQALGQHTKEIESIVQTIGTLSSRTDLLALNASIESVRAGEHGRGFAIVAEEVRALAEQSAQAVLDITRRIEMIQLETHQSISVASGEHDQMHEVIKRVTTTLDSLQDICDAASESAAGLTEISDSTHQHLQITREIVIALERSTETSRKNRSRAEGANWTAKTLGQIGEQLGESLELFRLSGALTGTTEESGQAPRVESNTRHEQEAVMSQ